jgi:hypothetical protein
MWIQLFALFLIAFSPLSANRILATLPAHSNASKSTTIPAKGSSMVQSLSPNGLSKTTKSTGDPLTPQNDPSKASNLPKLPSIYEDIYRKACKAIAANKKERQTCNLGYTKEMIQVFSLMSEETHIEALKVWTDTSKSTSERRRNALKLRKLRKHRLKSDQNLNGNILSES